ncbi:hypothetical protein [Synechococcus sp. UW140]|uniref:hypothetical protein n=1 Tax=Synechococcus sp. UW140 TaxID=368503 RepID=UPI0031382149
MPLLLTLPLIAATPPAFVPFKPPVGVDSGLLRLEPLDPLNADRIQVDNFDPEAYAQYLVGTMPRQWRGALSTKNAPRSIVAELNINRLVAIGQRLDLFGVLTLGGQSVPVQANINAKSDQMEMLLLGDKLPVGLEPGGEFQGLEMLKLSSWEGPRLTSAGAILELAPVANSAPAPAVRGLW